MDGIESMKLSLVNRYEEIIDNLKTPEEQRDYGVKNIDLIWNYMALEADRLYKYNSLPENDSKAIIREALRDCIEDIMQYCREKP